MCTTLSAPKDKALAMHKDADTKVKAALEQLFGKEQFQPITNRIKTIADACKAVGTTLAKITNEDDTVDEAAYKKLKVIAAALNEGWVPDWSNEDEYKWQPWLKFNEGSGFSLSLVRDNYTNSYVPSRLCFRSRELAEYSVNQFTDIYNDYFL